MVSIFPQIFNLIRFYLRKERVFIYDNTINSLPYQNPKFHSKNVIMQKKTTKTNLTD